MAQGPGFGTNFTLACPYTLLAHYHELDWAASCGVEASLVRVWVGLDPPEHLLEVFGSALDAAAVRPCFIACLWCLSGCHEFALRNVCWLRSVSLSVVTGLRCGVQVATDAGRKEWPAQLRSMKEYFARHPAPAHPGRW